MPGIQLTIFDGAQIDYLQQTNQGYRQSLQRKYTRHAEKFLRPVNDVIQVVILHKRKKNEIDL